MCNYYYIQNGELCHFGIKGMKWGVRRFQDKNGKLTNAGKKRYSDDDQTSAPKQKSKHRLHLEEKYKKQGMTQKEAEEAAAKRIKTEKIVTAAAGMSLAAAGAYVIHKNLKTKADGVIKTGTSLSRVEMRNDSKLHDAFYVAKDKSDKTKYAGKLGLTRHMQVGEAYIMDIGVKKDIKIAGNKTAQKTFEDLFRNDGEFRNAAMKLSKTNVHGGNAAELTNMKKMYENFNTNLIRHDEPAVKKYYDTLRSKGYGAVRDINDMKFSGYNAKNPLIVFGGGDKVGIKSFRELTKEEASKKYIQDGMREATKTAAAWGTAGLTVGALSMYSEDYEDDDYYNYNQTRRY